QFRSNRDVTAVEEDVQIRAKQKAIRHSVRPRRGIRSDMCSLQDGQRALSADRTALLVSIRYKHAKSTLSEARAGKILRPIPRPFLLDLSQAWVERQASEHLMPKRAPGSLRVVVTFALHDIWRPVRWDWNPLLLRPKERLGENGAANDWIWLGLCGPAVALDSGAERRGICDSVLQTECRPRE